MEVITEEATIVIVETIVEAEEDTITTVEVE
jgi:hypothetical protein